MDNPDDQSLVQDINDYYFTAAPIMRGQQNVVRHYSRVSMVGPNWVRLERPLPVNVSMEWNPELHFFRPLVSEGGIEDLTVQFPVTPYPGHLKVGGGLVWVDRSLYACDPL
jgi:hypothetical protein